jgi:Flp pilus assembly pilin Flp
MMWLSPATPLGFLEMILRERVHRARTAPTRGASAVEWVVISAIIVAIAIAVGVILNRALSTKAEDIEQQIGDADGNI